MRKSAIVVLVLLISLMGISLKSVRKIAEQLQPDTQLTAICKWGNAPAWSPTAYDYFARYDFVALSPGAYPGSTMDSLRIRNGDIMLGMYFNVHTVAQWMERATPGSYPNRLWTQLAPHYLKTTTGDTACVWLNNPLYDFTDPTVRVIALDILVPYVEANNFDWLFLDFFSVRLPDLKKFQLPIYSELEEGEWDFDQDGIPYLLDAGERQAVIEGEYAFMQELSEALPGVLLIPNGDLAIYDPYFRTLTDGMFLEQFPWFFWGGESAHMENALDPDYPFSLPTLVSPGYYVFIEDEFNAGTYGIIAALFDGVVETKHMKDVYPPLPTELNFGKPSAAPYVEGHTWFRGFPDTTVYFSY